MELYGYGDYLDSSWDTYFENLDFEEIVDEAIKLFPDLFFQASTRKRPAKVDFWSINWDTYNPESTLGKLFRRRFRIPFPAFKEVLLPRCQEANLFGTTVESKVRVPLEFKILVSPRILSRGNVCDDIFEMSGVPEKTCDVIFHRFCEQFDKIFYGDYVKPPSGERLQKVMEIYAELGQHGALGSMDATHLHWNKCPKGLKNLCKGKESYHSDFITNEVFPAFFSLKVFEGSASFLSSMKSPRCESSSSPIGVSRDTGSLAIFMTLRTLSSGITNFSANSSGVGSRPISCSI
jgi:hypothetical protein